MSYDVTVGLYNTKKKELVGVFKTLAIASRYIFNEHSTWNNSRIWNAYAFKTKLYKNTNFDFPIVIRTANEKCLELLGNKEVYIASPYPRMSDQRIRGMKSVKT